MSSRAATVVLLVLATVSLFAFGYILRQLSLVSIGLAAHQEVEEQLRRSLDDQKKLARLDPASQHAYRERFDSIVTLTGRLRVLQFNRRELAAEVEKMLLGMVGLILASGSALYLLERRSRERRLVRLEEGVGALSRGESEIVLGERRRDVIGRIAATVERSARAAAQDRRRLRYLEHLSAWQEAARRHAHEMRTPLAAARMDVERFTATVRRQLPELTPDIDAVRTSLLEELDRLREFTRQFTSFATIPKPRPRPIDVARFVSDFATSFGPAWPGVELIARGDGPAMVSADGDMLRQVLVNLTNNSALAMGEGGGTVTFTVRAAEQVTVDVTDSGPGVAPEIRNRLFEPYTTTRGIGEGMGLGLAISKKILLDHGGDLDYVPDGAGATFRLTFPRLEASA
jgi:two-component system, NtrC family, nitrogen regulation sensor histidine kinase NtrY